jgi:hypothetical protein
MLYDVPPTVEPPSPPSVSAKSEPLLIAEGDVRVLPVAEEMAKAEAQPWSRPSPAGAHPEDWVDWEQALYEEARAGEPSAATPALPDLPVPDTAEASWGVLPPRPGRTGTEGAGSLSATVPALEATIEPAADSLSSWEEQPVSGLPGSVEDRFLELDGQIDRAYEQVIARLGENNRVATACFDQLLQAREIILHRDGERIAEAEYCREQVRATLHRADASEMAARTLGWLLVLWGFLWFAGLTSLLVLLGFDWFHNLIIPRNSSLLAMDLSVVAPAMVWGSLGGVAALLYHLFQHIGRRDFDRRYTLSYIGKPVLGAILGALAYVGVHLLVLLLGVLPAGLVSLEEAPVPLILPWLVYLLAWTAGFQENRILSLMDRAFKRALPATRVTPVP